MTGDWRNGQPAIHYAQCITCGTVWYLARPHCPHCGAADPAVRTASGAGVVVAVTRVERAPSPEWRALLPYSIALVDAAEGFRMMAHAAPGVEIGDAVTVRFQPGGDALLPCFEGSAP